MATIDPYDTGDGAPSRPQPAPYQQPRPPAPVTTSPTPTQAWEQPSTPAPQTSQAPGAPPPGTQPPTSPYQMNTNFQYQMPGGTNAGTSYAQPLGQYAGKLEGFEQSKLDDPTRTSAKYQFARVASRYAPTQQGFSQLMQDPEFQRLGMQSLGNGKVRLPNGDVIDVVRGFQSGGQAWQWGAETVNGQATDWGAPGPQGQPAQQDPWAQYAQQQQAWQQQQYQQQQAQWQQYQQQLQAWQQQQQQNQQAGYDAGAWNNLTPEQQGGYYAQGGAPTGYYPPTQPLPASPDYGGAGGYNTGVGLQSGGGSPYSSPYNSPYYEAFNYLGNGLPPPYNYGY